MGVFSIKALDYCQLCLLMVFVLPNIWINVKWGHRKGLKPLSKWDNVHNAGCKPMDLPPVAPELCDREDQINHETVNLVHRSIVWKEITARTTNPGAVRDKY